MKKINSMFIALSAILLLGSLTGSSVFADQKGTEIMKKVSALPAGNNRSIKAAMAIIPPSGKPEIKEFSIVSKQSGKTVFSRSTFTKPTHIEFLSWSSPKATSQWIKLSSGSIRKIAVSDQSGSFVGSDFYYEDLGDNSMENFNYTYQGEQRVNDDPCYVIKSVRVKGSSVYTKVLIYVRKSDYFVLKVDMFEKKGHTKTLYNQRIEKIQGVLVPKKVVMERVDTGGKTIIYMKSIDFKKSYPDSYFSKEAL